MTVIEVPDPETLSADQIQVLALQLDTARVLLLCELRDRDRRQDASAMQARLSTLSPTMRRLSGLLGQSKGRSLSTPAIGLAAAIAVIVLCLMSALTSIVGVVKQKMHEADEAQQQESR